MNLTGKHRLAEHYPNFESKAERWLAPIPNYSAPSPTRTPYAALTFLPGMVTSQLELIAKAVSDLKDSVLNYLPSLDDLLLTLLASVVDLNTYHYP